MRDTCGTSGLSFQMSSWSRVKSELIKKNVLNPLTPVSAKWQMALIDFTLSNARRFYSSMGNPAAVEGLTKNIKKPSMSPFY